MSMRIWIVQAGENNEGLDIVSVRTDDGADRPLVFADTAEGYGEAFDAFRKLSVALADSVKVVYTFGDFGTDARADVTATGYTADCADPDCGCSYAVDIINLKAFEVIGRTHRLSLQPEVMSEVADPVRCRTGSGA